MVLTQGTLTLPDGNRRNQLIQATADGELKTEATLSDVVVILTQLLQTMNRPSWLYGPIGVPMVYPAGGTMTSVTTVGSVTTFGVLPAMRLMSDTAWSVGVGRLIS